MWGSIRGVRNRGRFFIPFFVIENDPDAVMAIMGKMIILKAEVELHRDGVMYAAISSLFDPVEEGYVVPLYQFVIQTADGLNTVKEAFVIDSDHEPAHVTPAYHSVSYTTGPDGKD